jgi:signal transduction histidine kinase
MTILIVSGVEGVRNCAEFISKQLEMQVEFASGRRAALGSLRREEFAVVVLDETLADGDPEAAEAIWERSGLAIPMQINFALAGAARIIREIRAALQRRQREQAVARRAARQDICGELKNTLNGLLLHSQLALAERGIPNDVAQKLRTVEDLAGKLRMQLAAVPALEPVQKPQRAFVRKGTVAPAQVFKPMASI